MDFRYSCKGEAHRLERLFLSARARYGLCPTSGAQTVGLEGYCCILKKLRGAKSRHCMGVQGFPPRPLRPILVLTETLLRVGSPTFVFDLRVLRGSRVNLSTQLVHVGQWLRARGEGGGEGWITPRNNLPQTIVSRTLPWWQFGLWRGHFEIIVFRWCWLHSRTHLTPDTL